MGRHCLDTAWPNRDLGPGDARGLAQKRGLSRIPLDQLDAGNAEDREHEPRQSGAAAEVDQVLGRTRDKTKKLRRIEHMPPPQSGESVAADEVDARRPAGQQIGIGLQPRECFT